jgi:hypothetical protein
MNIVRGHIKSAERRLAKNKPHLGELPESHPVDIKPPHSTSFTSHDEGKAKPTWGVQRLSENPSLRYVILTHLKAKFWMTF